MTDTEYRIVMTLSDVCTAVSRMNRVLRDTMDSRDQEYIEESLQLAVKAGQPLMDALMERLKQGPLSPPSSDDKTPTAATGEVNSGTPEFKAGDRVALKRYSGSNHGVITSLNTDGTCALTMDSGHVEYAHVTELERGQNWAAPEFASHSVGDRVEFRAYATPHLDQILRGVIRTIGSDGTALIDSEGGVYCRDLCILKNLSRP